MPPTILHGRSTVRVCFLVLMIPLSVAAQDDRASTARRGDVFARGAWHLELTGAATIETWNYNISHESVFGFEPALTYAVRDGLTLRAAWPLCYVDQRGIDGVLIGTTIGVRARVFRRARTSVFIGLDLGVSHADTFVPPGGTRFNYLALGSAGLTFRLRRGVHGVAGLRWIHVSNNGLAGRSRNPDIEAVGLKAGVLMGF